MRFKTEIQLTAAVGSLEKIAWVRLDDDSVRITVIPDIGSQVWASLSADLIFDNYSIQSAEENNTINLELPMQPLQRALKSASAANAISTTLRLTKKGGLPVLSMTITAAGTVSGGGGGGGAPTRPGGADEFGFGDDDAAAMMEMSLRREREKIITQDIPVRVLHPTTVETIMQPKVREPDVHIQLPPLLQLKAMSDRFTRLASGTVSGAGGTGSGGGGPASTLSGGATSGTSNMRAPKLALSANMHGGLRLRTATDGSAVESEWRGLVNPALDPAQLAMPLAEHPSTHYREGGPDMWATVHVDGRDWSKVLSVGRLDGRVIACFSHDHALILYVYVTHVDEPGSDDSVITYYVQSYSV
ncbi:Checkpoint protein hus1 [Ceratocystis pirilliformis]|uniref:Checkpoint protein n=1 Tax=Ceratocystis pirilliformis TaxID=259994 RepID=A0ABR3YUS7_9PEZI